MGFKCTLAGIFFLGNFTRNCGKLTENGLELICRGVSLIGMGGQS